MGKLPFKVTISNKPKPIPAAPLFAEKKLPNGRTIWLSVPQLDRLSLTISINKSLYGLGVPQDTPVLDYAAKLGTYLASGDDLPKYEKAKLYPGGWKSVSFRLGPAKSFVIFQIEKPKKSPLLRLEFNPRTLGISGFNELAHLLGDVINRQALVTHGKVTKLDLAIDVVGMHVSEVILHAKNQGKRVLYVGSDGRLETVYIQRKRKQPTAKTDASGSPLPVSPRTTNPILRAYDVARKERDHGLPTTFGNAEVTRIEVVALQKKLYLAHLNTMKNPFDAIRAGFVGSQKLPSVGLSAYLATRRTSARREARAFLGLHHQKDSKDDAEMVSVPDLLSKETWEGFPTGMELSGLQSFITIDECN